MATVNEVFKCLLQQKVFSKSPAPVSAIKSLQSIVYGYIYKELSEETLNDSKLPEREAASLARLPGHISNLLEELESLNIRLPVNVNPASLMLLTQGTEKALTGGNIIAHFETSRKVINRDYNPICHSIISIPYPSGKQLHDQVELMRIALYKVESAQKRGVDFTIKEIVDEVKSPLHSHPFVLKAQLAELTLFLHALGKASSS